VNILSNTDITCPEQIKQEITKSFQNTANTLLLLSTLTGTITLITQIINLWNLVEAVDQADEKIKLSPNQRRTLKARLKGIEARLSELDGLLVKLNAPNITPIKITAISARARQMEVGINVEMDRVLDEIGKWF